MQEICDLQLDWIFYFLTVICLAPPFTLDFRKDAFFCFFQGFEHHPNLLSIIYLTPVLDLVLSTFLCMFACPIFVGIQIQKQTLYYLVFPTISYTNYLRTSTTYAFHARHFNYLLTPLISSRGKMITRTSLQPIQYLHLPDEEPHLKTSHRRKAFRYCVC